MTISSPASNCVIRPAQEADFEAIAAIYAHGVLHGTGTFETEPPSPSEMINRWKTVQALSLPWLVACESEATNSTPAPQILGFCYANQLRPRQAFKYCVEDSVYIAPSAQGQGLGKALLAALMARCTQMGMRQMVAVIGDSQNLASIALHTRQGFRSTGLIRSAGWKFGRWLDVVYMQTELGSGDAQAPEEGQTVHPKP